MYKGHAIFLVSEIFILVLLNVCETYFVDTYWNSLKCVLSTYVFSMSERFSKYFFSQTSHLFCFFSKISCRSQYVTYNLICT